MFYYRKSLAVLIWTFEYITGRPRYNTTMKLTLLIISVITNLHVALSATQCP